MLYRPFSLDEETYLNKILLFVTLYSQLNHMCFRLYFFFYSFLHLLGRSGILTVKILELHEECTIQVAMCEQLAGLQAQSSSQGTGLKVLFTKETAYYLRAHPQDVIHIYPPWWVERTDSRGCQPCLSQKTFLSQTFLSLYHRKTPKERSQDLT